MRKTAIASMMAGASRAPAPGLLPVLGQPWLSIVPIAESRSSYSGGVVLAFVVLSGSLVVYAIHRLASHALRRGPAWDCGFPDPSPRTQYTAASFAQPIRRVFGTGVFRARERVEMPPPGDARPVRLHVALTDLVWETLYAPVAGVVGAIAGRLDHLQLLTRPEVGGGGGRLRARRRVFRGKLCGGAGRSAHPGLPADPDRAARRPARVARGGRGAGMMRAIGGAARSMVGAGAGDW